jgi:hypothetical protein
MAASSMPNHFRTKILVYMRRKTAVVASEKKMLLTMYRTGPRVTGST